MAAAAAAEVQDTAGKGDRLGIKEARDASHLEPGCNFFWLFVITIS